MLYINIYSYSEIAPNFEGTEQQTPSLEKNTLLLQKCNIFKCDDSKMID